MAYNGTGFVPVQNYTDNSSRLKVTQHQNIFEADFEYGTQPLRWEIFTAGAGTVVAQPGSGGVAMTISGAANDITIRQSRPYHRYQPGKTMYMATGFNYGAANLNQRQRVGFFDDANGIFFEQADPTLTNPFGMFLVYRNDINGVPTDTRISFENWSDPNGVKSTINWNNIQMLWIEYAWYGAGLLRWGVLLNGVPQVFHQIGIGNTPNQLNPWARTGNLPVRYEQRNIAASIANTMYHYGVSVLVEGGQNDQRGFTYAYGLPVGTPRRQIAPALTRFPVMSLRFRTMGTQEYTQASAAVQAGATTSAMTVAGTPWTANQWAGRYVFFPGLGAQGNGAIGRIMSNTTNTLNYVDNLTGLAISTAPGVGAAYQIGIINRGLVLPRSLKISSDSLCQVELIASTPGNPVVLTSSAFVAQNTLGSPNSFSERDVSATAMAGGEVVYAFTSPAGGSGLQDIDLSNLFPLYNVIQGNRPDILTVAISTSAVVAPPAISTGTISGNTGTLTFATTHNFQPGMGITLAGFTPAGWNGPYTVLTVPTTTTLTIATAVGSASTVQGTATFTTNVGVHLLGQEQMS